MSSWTRRVLSAALVGVYLAIAPSTGRPLVTQAPAVVLSVGEPTPSLSVRPRR